MRHVTDLLFSKSTIPILFLFFLFTGLQAQSSCEITGPSEVCTGDVSVYHIDVDAPVAYNIIWATPNGTSMGSSNEMIVVHWNLSGTVNLTARIYSASTPQQLLGACTYQVNVLPPPNPEISPLNLPLGYCMPARADGFKGGYCSASQAIFQPVGNNGQYDWTVDGNFVDFTIDPSNNNLTVNLSAQGSFEVCLTETNSAGCSNTICESYDIFAPPVASISEISHGTTSPISVCKGEQLMFLGGFNDPNGLPLGSWFWEVEDAGGNLVGSGFDQNFSYTFGTPGHYRVWLYVTNCQSCSSERVYLDVIVNDATAPVIACPSVVCQSETPISYCTPEECQTYIWTVQGGQIQGDASGHCIDVVWSMPPANGYGLVTLEVADCNSSVCILPTTVEVPVIPNELEVQGPTAVCDPNATLTYLVPNYPGANYNWTYEILTNPNPGTISPASPANGNSFSVYLNNFIGSFQVNVTLNHDVTQCTSTGTLVANSLDYSISGGTFCYNADVPLSIIPPPPSTYEIMWTVVETNQQMTTTNTPDVTLPFSFFGDAGDFTVRAAIVFANGQVFDCGDLITTVYINDPVTPITDVQGPTMVCPGVLYNYKAIPAQPGVIEWVMSGGLPAVAQGSSVNVTWQAGMAPFSLSAHRLEDGCPSEPFQLDLEEITNQPLTISGASTVCEDEMSVYTASIDGADSYEWLINYGTYGSIVSGQGTPEIKIQWHAVPGSPPTNLFIRLKAKVCGTFITVDYPVTIIPKNVELYCISSVNDCRFCQNSEGWFLAYPVANSQYEWFVDDVPQPPSNPGNELVYLFTEPGTHVVRVKRTVLNCSDTVENALSVEVVANPDPVIFQSNLINCDEPKQLTLNATTYPGADSETFFWTSANHVIAPPVYNVVPAPDGPQLIIESSNIDDYLGQFYVSVTRTIDGLTCYADNNYTVDCITITHDTGNPPVISTDWGFDLNVPFIFEGNQGGAGENGNACGHIIAKADLGSIDFANEVENAFWEVSDPNNGLSPVDIFPVTNQQELEHTDISVFTHAGIYLANFNVKYYNDPATYFITRLLEIPVVPNLHVAYECSSSTPGTFDLKLRDISELVPTASISNKHWEISINGVPTYVFDDNASEIIRNVPGGSSVTICFTPTTYTVLGDNPGLQYYCTYCVQIDMPVIPDLSIETSQTMVCSGSPIAFTAHASPASGIISYTWDFGDYAYSHLISTQHTYGSGGDFNVTLTALTEYGCAFHAEQTVHTQSNLDLTGYIHVMKDDCQSSATLMFEPWQGTPVAWNWSPGNETSEAIMVTNTDVYDVTVTDAFGCTFSPPSVGVEFPSLFSGGISGDLNACTGHLLHFSINTTPGFQYDWTTNLPNKSSSYGTLTAGPAPAGNYSVMVTATQNGMSCISISTTVSVHPTPDLPDIQVDYTCEPFTAHLSSVPAVDMVWMHNNVPYGYGSEILAFQGGYYTAIATNEFGCNAETGVSVENPIDVYTLSGCYTLCDTLLLSDCIKIPAPSGTYTAWEWLLLPDTDHPLSSGTGHVQDLCLTPDMQGKIVLHVKKDYHNSNPPPSGSITTCEATSDPFCLEVEHCGVPAGCGIRILESCDSTGLVVLTAVDENNDIVQPTNYLNEFIWWVYDNEGALGGVQHKNVNPIKVHHNACYSLLYEHYYYPPGTHYPVPGYQDSICRLELTKTCVSLECPGPCGEFPDFTLAGCGDDTDIALNLPFPPNCNSACNGGGTLGVFLNGQPVGSNYFIHWGTGATTPFVNNIPQNLAFVTIGPDEKQACWEGKYVPSCMCTNVPQSIACEIPIIKYCHEDGTVTYTQGDPQISWIGVSGATSYELEITPGGMESCCTGTSLGAGVQYYTDTLSPWTIPSELNCFTIRIRALGPGICPETDWSSPYMYCPRYNACSPVITVCGCCGERNAENSSIPQVIVSENQLLELLQNSQYPRYSTLEAVLNSMGWGSENEPAPDFLIYPNPASQVLRIEPGAPLTDPYVVNLCDLLQRPVIESSLDGASGLDMDIHNLPDGMYYLKIFDGSGNLKWSDKVLILK